MKKKIKTLTKEDIAKICFQYRDCSDCPYKYVTVQMVNGGESSFCIDDIFDTMNKTVEVPE